LRRFDTKKRKKDTITIAEPDLRRRVKANYHYGVISHNTHYESTPLPELAAVPHQETAVILTADGALPQTPGFLRHSSGVRSVKRKSL
jgi:hypothetical protein